MRRGFVLGLLFFQCSDCSCEHCFSLGYPRPQSIERLSELGDIMTGYAAS